MNIQKRDKEGGGKELLIFNDQKTYEDVQLYDLKTLTTTQEPVEMHYLNVSWDEGEDSYTVSERADERKGSFQAEFKSEAKMALLKTDRYMISDFPAGDKPGTAQQILDYRAYLRGFIADITSDTILVINATTNIKEEDNKVQDFATWLAAQQGDKR